MSSRQRCQGLQSKLPMKIAAVPGYMLFEFMSETPSLHLRLQSGFPAITSTMASKGLTRSDCSCCAWPPLGPTGSDIVESLATRNLDGAKKSSEPKNIQELHVYYI